MANLLDEFFPHRVSDQSRKDGFKLKAMFHARVYCVADTDSDIAKVPLHVEIPEFYKHAPDTQSPRWRTPIGFAGNSASGLWTDERGSLAEHFECIPFNTVRRVGLCALLARGGAVMARCRAGRETSASCWKMPIFFGEDDENEGTERS